MPARVRIRIGGISRYGDGQNEILTKTRGRPDGVRGAVIPALAGMTGV